MTRLNHALHRERCKAHLPWQRLINPARPTKLPRLTKRAQRQQHVAQLSEMLFNRMAVLMERVA